MKLFLNESETRKKRSEKLLKKLGADFLPSLPLIESGKETLIKSSDEIGKRIICLLCVAATADGFDKTRILNWLKKEDLISGLSKDELKFLKSKKLNEKDRIRYSWSSEKLWVLLWAVGKVKRDLPTAQCLIKEILDVVPKFEAPTKEYISSLKVISKRKIMDMADFLYRAHWTTRQYRFAGDVKTGSLDTDVVPEWHYAVNWLINYEQIEDWDEITTDT